MQTRTAELVQFSNIYTKTKHKAVRQARVKTSRAVQAGKQIQQGGKIPKNKGHTRYDDEVAKNEGITQI